MFSLRSLSGLALLVAGALYATTTLPLFGVYSIFDRGDLTICGLIFSLPFYVWLGLGALASGADDTYLAVRSLIDAHLTSDVASLRIEPAPTLLHARRGAPYAFRTLARSYIVISDDWLEYLHKTCRDDPSRLERAAQAVLLHGLGHIHSGDTQLR